MDALIVPLLLLLTVIAVIQLVLLGALWIQHHGLVTRVAKLEALQENGLSAQEVRQLFDRMSNVEGQTFATNQIMTTVQRHLLERDE